MVEDLYIEQLEFGPMANFVYMIGSYETRYIGALFPRKSAPAVLGRAGTVSLAGNCDEIEEIHTAPTPSAHFFDFEGGIHTSPIRGFRPEFRSGEVVFSVLTGAGTVRVDPSRIKQLAALRYGTWAGNEKVHRTVRDGPHHSG